MTKYLYRIWSIPLVQCILDLTAVDMNAFQAAVVLDQ